MSMTTHSEHHPGSGIYVSAGPWLTFLELSLDGARLCEQSALHLPSKVQYAWQSPVHPILYVVTGDGYDPDADSCICVVNLKAESGNPTEIAQVVRLSSRPIHTSTDARGRWLFVASGGGNNCPNRIDVYKIGADGKILEHVPQSATLGTGILPHQILAAPDGKYVFVCYRGNAPQDGYDEEPGSIVIYRLGADGRLADHQTVAPGNGIGFRPRHIEFHPNGRWVYAAIEEQNLLQMYEWTGGRLSHSPLFSVSTLTQDDRKAACPQVAGAIHIHPSGRYVYVSNRGNVYRKGSNRLIQGMGENSIAIFSIDQETGEPYWIGNVSTQSFHPRTFSVNDQANMLVAAGVLGYEPAGDSREGAVPPRLSILAIAGGGHSLNLLRTVDVDMARGAPFWCGFWRKPMGAGAPARSLKDVS